MLVERPTSSVWLVSQNDHNTFPNKLTTLDNYSLPPYYSHSSLYKAETLINGHLKKNWNTFWTKVVAINEIILGLLIFIIGNLIVFFHLSLSITGHGIWAGILAFLSGLFAFLTIVYRYHRYFMIVATIHVITSLASTILIFISIFALALQFNANYSNLTTNMNDRQLNNGLHFTLIVLGLYEKLLCYTFLIMIIRHTRKMA